MGSLWWRDMYGWGCFFKVGRQGARCGKEENVFLGVGVGGGGGIRHFANILFTFTSRMQTVYSLHDDRIVDRFLQKLVL